MNKRIFLFIALILIMCSAAGCSSKNDTSGQSADKGNEAAPKQFEADGATITLTSDFIETKQDKYTFQYSSPNVLCIGQKELKTDIAASGVTISSLADYAKIVMQNVDINAEYSEYGQSLYFEWDKNINDTYYSYLGFVTETDDAYWLIQFAALRESYSGLRNDFFTYYDSFTM